VLDLTVTEAAAWFAQIGEREKLSTRSKFGGVGLGSLGWATTQYLSGGESND